MFLPIVLSFTGQLPVKERIYFKLLTIIYHCVHGLAPTYLQYVIQLYSSINTGHRLLRPSLDGTRLHIPLYQSLLWGVDRFMLLAPVCGICSHIKFVRRPLSPGSKNSSNHTFSHCITLLFSYSFVYVYISVM